MRYLLLTLILFAAVTAVSANNEETSQLSGRVINEKSGEGLPGVHVMIEALNLGTVTDFNGRFTIKNIPSGKHTLLLSMIGYSPVELDLELTGADIDLTIKMTEEIRMLKGAVIESFSITGGMSNVNELAGSAHYISPKDLEKFSYNDINRVLRSVPGVNIQEEDGFGLRPNIGLRGTGVERSSKITLMEDGILIAPAPYVAPAAYYFPTTGRMQGIEIRKGSSQIMYGPYTTGGAINLLSTSIPDTFMGRIHLFGGSFGQVGLHAFAGDASERAGFMVETYQAGSNGFKELDNGGDTGFRIQDYVVKARVSTKSDAKVYQSLQVKAGRYIEQSDETYLGLTDADFEDSPLRRYAGSQVDVMDADQKQLVITHFIEPTTNLKLNTSFYRTEFNRNWYKLDKVKSADSTGFIGIATILDSPSEFSNELDIIRGGSSAVDDALAVKANNRSYYAQGIQTNGKWEIGQQGNHTLDFGIRYHVDEIDRYQWVDFYQMINGYMGLTEKGEPGTESNRIERANALAVFAQYSLQLSNVTIVPGLRYENIRINRKDYGKNDPERTGVDLSERENTVSVWIPGIGVEYNPYPGLIVFGGIHKGFSPPGSKEGTQPESSINYELGIRRENSVFRASLVGFISDYQNLLGVDLSAGGGQGSGDLFNGGTAFVSGLEAELYFGPRLSDNLIMPLQLSYTYTNGYFTNSFESEFDAWGSVQSGDKLPYLAPHQLVFNAGIEHPKFTANISSKYATAMRTIAGQGELIDSQSTDAAFIIDASVQYNFKWNIGLFGNLNNITNNTFIVSRRPAGVRPALPRSFMAGVKFNF